LTQAIATPYIMPDQVDLPPIDRTLRRDEAATGPKLRPARLANVTLTRVSDA